MSTKTFSEGIVEAEIVDRAGARLALRLARGMSIAIIGTDGTGKSTATQMIGELIEAAGVPCARHHWYRWYQAMFFVPFAVLWSRWRKRDVSIFDRSAFDNVGTWMVHAHNIGLRGGKPWTGAAVRMLAAMMPRFDVVIFLVASPETIAQRRPTLRMSDILIAREIYADIGRALRLVPLDTIHIEKGR